MSEKRDNYTADLPPPATRRAYHIVCRDCLATTTLHDGDGPLVWECGCNRPPLTITPPTYDVPALAALTAAEGLLAELANSQPLYYSDYRHYWICVFCAATAIRPIDVQHKPDCLLTRAWLAQRAAPAGEAGDG